MELEREQLIAVLRKTHIGHVAMPGDHPAARSKTKDTMTPAGICLTNTVPNSLIRALNHRHGSPRVRLDVCSVASEHELWATLELHRVAGGLRFLMPLDDAGVRAFFREGVRGGDLRLTLTTEDETVSADIILGLNLGDGRELEKLLRKARCLDGSLTRLAQFAELMSCSASPPQVQCNGGNSQAVVVLASNRAHIIAAAPSQQEKLQGR